MLSEDLSWDKIELRFAESMRWATMVVTIREIAEENKELVRELSAYDPIITVPLLASLMTLPDYQSHCIRFEILVALAVAHCRGRKRANIGHVARWFFQIGKSKCVTGEDPAEDVFVTLLRGKEGDFLLLEGVWESAGFYTQRVLEVVSTMPDEGRFGHIKKSVEALLTISNMLCSKANLHRYEVGLDVIHSALSPDKLPSRNELVARMTIPFARLEASGITPADIEPFLFRSQMKAELADQQIGSSCLDRCPLIVNSNTEIVVAAPTALSVAMRNFVIASVMDSGMIESFDSTLATNYARLFFDTPLLGGPARARVVWRKVGEHRCATFYLQIDEEYFLSFHLVLPSVKIHAQGGFKTAFKVERPLLDALQTSVDDVVAHFEKDRYFKGGMVILVSCGWGKGCFAKNIKLANIKWRLENISAADLIRLSWLIDMSPGYFWRIQDGLESIAKAGIELINPNGILNLIAWVRKNRGHFVPHAQLPEGKITPDQRLIVNPPLNLLRELRAEADLGYDRHCAVDNAGIWHDVQRVSPNPFFSSASVLRIYGSMDDARRKTLTSVYQGALNFWISLSAPSISEKGVEYRLWEMANEWLHRISTALDLHAKGEVAHKKLKVYIEFRDSDPPTDAIQKPTMHDLIALCKIESHGEKNACRAIFEIGFISGFSIAENIAERLFCRNLAKAFLQLIGIENCDGEAKRVEEIVVQNDEARSFHFFRSQHFLDYVRDALPRELIAIDPIDDAAARIGLGWRVTDSDYGSKIVGKDECANFLRKVVDALLADIFVALGAFDRVSILKRLLANCEKARTHEDHWKRTSAAILGLHGRAPNALTNYVEQMSKFAGAGIASRVLCEFSLCVSPWDGGANISNIEMSKLIARAALLIRIGGLSDAIYFNALAPELKISPLGDILFRDDFGQFVVEPMLTQFMQDKFVTNAPRQKKNYEDPEIVPETKGKLNHEFWDAWTIEMGFDLDEARSIIGNLEDKGITDRLAVFDIRESEYFSLVTSAKVSRDAAKKFLHQFTLSSRPQWDKPPKGFSLKDIYPWRFGRRLSLVTRPILKINDRDDPLLIVAPGSLRKGFAYVVGGAYNGRLEQSFFTSKEMRDIWWGKAGEGHTFNAEVGRAFGGAGWVVRENIGLPEIFNRKIHKDWGDVDVFAWRPDQNEVLVVECKDISLARNYSEIAALLSEYQGAEIDGQPDKLRRHLERVCLLQAHTVEIQKFTGILEPNIVSCLVCSGVVPMQYAKIGALSETHIGTIKDILSLKFGEYR